MSASKPTILIVEADTPTLELYTQALGGDFRILGTLEQPEALKLAQREDVRAVVLEPGMNNNHGWDLLVEMRRTLSSKLIPIILCSSLDERRRGMELGVSAYLVKPVMPSELSAVIRRVLALSSRKNTTSR